MSYLGTTKIGKMYLGTVEIAKAYLGNTLVFQKGGGPTPPPVGNIPYIRGGADGSYIDTGITGDSTVRIIVWARNFNPSPENTILLGSQVAIDSKSIIIYTGVGTRVGDIAVRYGGSGNIYISDMWEYFSHYHKYELGPDGFFIDDIRVASISASSFSSSINIHIFGINNNGTHSGVSSAAIDVCACKIYKNDVLVRDYTAVNAPSVGLYDSVSGTMFTNAGSGDFTYGTFNNNSYIPLEYIESTQAQYFDTGIKGSYATPWIVKFAPTGTTARFEYPVGASTGSTKRCEIGIGNNTYINGRLYFNYQGSSNAIVNSNTNNRLTGLEIIHIKSENKASAYSGGTQLGSSVTGTTGADFVTDYNLYVGALNKDGVASNNSNSKFYYAGFGSLRNFVPAQVGTGIGMYDTYNDVFYESETETPFVSGGLRE